MLQLQSREPLPGRSTSAAIDATRDRGAAIEIFSIRALSVRWPPARAYHKQREQPSHATSLRTKSKTVEAFHGLQTGIATWGGETAVLSML